MSSVRTVFLLALAWLAALPATATALCDKDDPKVEESALEALADAHFGAIEEILPCAMVESGQLGAFCPEATIYVVTQNGTLLCRVLLPDVDLATAKSCDLTRRTPTPSPERVPDHAPSVLTSTLPPAATAPPLVSLGEGSLAAALAAPRPVYAEPPFVPG